MLGRSTHSPQRVFTVTFTADSVTSLIIEPYNLPACVFRAAYEAYYGELNLVHIARSRSDTFTRIPGRTCAWPDKLFTLSLAFFLAPLHKMRLHKTSEIFTRLYFFDISLVVISLAEVSYPLCLNSHKVHRRTGLQFFYKFFYYLCHIQPHTDIYALKSYCALRLSTRSSWIYSFRSRWWKTNRIYTRQQIRNTRIEWNKFVVLFLTFGPMMIK